MSVIVVTSLLFAAGMECPVTLLYSNDAEASSLSPEFHADIADQPALGAPYYSPANITCQSMLYNYSYTLNCHNSADPPYLASHSNTDRVLLAFNNHDCAATMSLFSDSIFIGRH